MKLKSYILSNGSRTIVFESMVHLAEPYFYDGIKNSIQKYKEKGYSYYYELAKKGTPESDIALGRLMGLETIGDLKYLYTFISNLTGLTMQPQAEFLNILNDKDYNADVSSLQLVEESKKFDFKEPSVKIKVAELEKVMPTIEKHKKFFQTFSKPILKLALTLATKMPKKGVFDKLLLEMRDRNLVSEVLKTENNLYITYGALHFNGFFKELLKQDSSWKVISTYTRKCL